MKTPKQKVLEHHPDAICRWNGDGCYYAVAAGQTIATGLSAPDAWRVAAILVCAADEQRKKTTELSHAVDDVVLSSMRRHTPGMVTILRTLIAIGETDERILERCREQTITPQTLRNVGHALAALQREGA